MRFDPMKDNELLEEILHDANIGWWRVDTVRCVFIFSDYLQKEIGIDSSEVSYENFIELIPEPYRIAFNYGAANKWDFMYSEQLLPLGDKWFRWKLLNCPDISTPTTVLRGYVQKVTTGIPDTPNELSLLNPTNNLLYRLNSISNTLLSFLHSGNIDNAIHAVLSDILNMFKGSRTYISEFDWDKRMHVCTYEVTDRGIESGRQEVNEVSIDDTPWWIAQLMQGNPIIISDVNDMPEEAACERNVLLSQGIRSIFVMPLMSHDKLWGYAGIDVVGETRNWDNVDYQWFASLVNIVNICIGLQRSDHEAQIERDYLQSLYRYMPLGYVRLRIINDKEGNPVDYTVLDANYATESIVGKPQSEFVGKTASELGLDLEEYLPGLIRTIHNEHYVESDSHMDNGKYIHAILYSTMQDEVTCLLNDTTDVRRTHSALDRNEKMLRNIYENIPVGIELYDKDGLLVDINKKDMEIFGVRNREDVKEVVNFYENPIVPPDIRERVRQHEEFSFKLYYPFNRLDNYYNSAKTGYIEIYTTVSMIYNEQGEPVNFMLINIDNTEINRAHSRIAEFENSFDLVSRFGQVGYARFDLLSREGFAMPQWYHNIGEIEQTPLDRVIGIYSHVDPADREQILALAEQIKEGKIEGFNRDLRIMDGNKVRWTRVNVIRNPLNNDPSKVELVCVNYDISELKQTERSLIEAKNKAEVSDRLKSAFLANMSHEIRTPLNAIVGFSALLSEADTIEERREYQTIVMENNDLLLKLISDILDLSKIEAGTLEFDNMEFDVNQMCREVIRTLSLKIGNKPVKLCLGDHLPECRLVSDKSRVMQVLSNFVNNALKFTSEGSITIGYHCDESNMLRFYVQDTGSGICSTELSSIFGRFVKLNNFSQGAGLGLAICKSIVEQLQGTIGVDSEVGKGSCFWFTHPYTQPSEPTPKPTIEQFESNIPAIDTNDRRPVILIAEDTESNFMLLTMILKREFDLLHAENGKQAVEMFREASPDLILMDLKMPVMDGLEATRQIRSLNATIPIIATTAFAYDQDRQRALEAGCTDYMTKPVAADQLKRCIRSLLGGCAADEAIMRP